MDNCWDYNDGAERDSAWARRCATATGEKVFLMTKIDGRSKKEAAQQLDESLRRLQTDRIDLVQHHEVIRYEDPDRIFDEEGAKEALLEARQAGKIRYIGFTGHKDPHIHLQMLEVAAEHGFDVRRGPDAAQRDGRALPQLREAGAAGARAAQDRRAGHEADGERDHPADRRP